MCVLFFEFSHNFFKHNTIIAYYLLLFGFFFIPLSLLMSTVGLVLVGVA